MGERALDAPGNEPSESNASESNEKSAVKSVADTTLPLEVGTIAIGEDGHISHGPSDRVLHFRFRACDIDFEAEIASGQSPLRITANLGKLPFTAESPDGRRLARSVLAATDRLRHGQILLSDEQDMVLRGELSPPTPRTPVNVIATAVALVLDFKPYIGLLTEAIALHHPRLATAGKGPAADPATVRNLITVNCVLEGRRPGRDR